MLCYNLSLQYKSLLKVEIKDDDKDKNKESLEDKMVKLNAEIYSHTSQDDFFAVGYSADDDCLEFAVAVWPDRISVSKVIKIIMRAVEKTCGAEGITVSPIEEITTKKYSEMLEEADNRDYMQRSVRKTSRDLDFDFYGNSYFKINQL